MGETRKSNPRWREENGVIYFSITSDGTSGKDWIERLENKGISVHPSAKEILLSNDFKPTCGVMTEIAVLKGELWTDDNRGTGNMLREAKRRNLKKASVEIACLMRDYFTDEELESMGLLWIVVMHEPIEVDYDHCPCLLNANRYEGSWLGLSYGGEDEMMWFDTFGFAFTVK